MESELAKKIDSMVGPRRLNRSLMAILQLAQNLHSRWNQRSLNRSAPARIESCGGRIDISYSDDGPKLPIIPGINDGQMLEPAARIHIWLPTLPYEELSQLRPILQSLANLVSLHIEGTRGSDASPKKAIEVTARSIRRRR